MSLKKLVFLILLAFLCGNCQSKNSSSSSIQTQENIAITVSSAVSLKESFIEIGNLYKSKSGKDINFNFGASGVLQKQIETGAPVDIFASAGEKQMDELLSKGFIESQSRRDFAQNELVLIIPSDSKLNLTDFSRLEDSSVKKIAVGNPKTVPAGQYTEKVFEKLNLKNSLQPKLIFAEDVRQVLDYVARGETDAGIVYASDAQFAREKVRIAAKAPKEGHRPILYPIAIIKDSQRKQSAEEFVNLVLSAEGQNVLRNYGFISVAVE